MDPSTTGASGPNEGDGDEGTRTSLGRGGRGGRAVRGAANWNLGVDANFKLRNYTLRFTVEDRA